MFYLESLNRDRPRKPSFTQWCFTSSPWIETDQGSLVLPSDVLPYRAGAVSGGAPPPPPPWRRIVAISPSPPPSPPYLPFNHLPRGALEGVGIRPAGKRHRQHHHRTTRGLESRSEWFQWWRELSGRLRLPPPLSPSGKFLLEGGPPHLRLLKGKG